MSGAGVRRLIFGGKYDEAFELCDEKFSLHASHGMPYQTAGPLLLPQLVIYAMRALGLYKPEKAAPAPGEETKKERDEA